MFKPVLAVLVAALAVSPAAFAGGPAMTIGATEDIVKQPTATGAKAQMDLLKLAGLNGVRMTQEWAPGQTEPAAGDLDALKNAAGAAQLDGVKVVLSVTNHGSRTLNGGRWRFTRFCSRWSASTSLPVTITSTSETRSGS